MDRLMARQKIGMDPMISAPDSNEYVNTLSHMIGAIVSVPATALLIIFAAQQGKWAHLAGFGIYGATLFLSLLASGVLHLFLLRGHYKRLLGVLDHCAIYLLIAGTYTPFCLTLLRGAAGWLLLAVVWSLAIFWIVLKAAFFVRMSSTVSNMSYISLGWLVIFFVVPLYSRLGAAAILLMIAAGVTYTVGAVSFQRATPNPFPPYFGNHEIWHFAVLAGNALFFFMMLFYILPYPG
jgi:hemolysin III